MMTPPQSASSSPHFKASQSPLDVASMSQHVLPLEITPSSQMSAEPSFTKPEEQTPKITVTQPALFGHHRNLATIPIASPLLTPNHYQSINRSQFAENNPTNHQHASPALYGQTERSAFSTCWSPAFQQNLFSPDYSKEAGYQMPLYMVYQPTGPYCSRQDNPQTFAVPEFSRAPDYNVSNIHGLPFRTGSPSHPSILHYSDSWDVKSGM